jgi:crossover junction endodeoxyribonuclease RuvC
MPHGPALITGAKAPLEAGIWRDTPGDGDESRSAGRRPVASRSMRVLGVDPGLTRCGLGVVEGSGGRSVRAVAVDVVRTPPEAEVAQRLGAVADAVEAWIAEHRPDVVAVERVFAQHNVRTVMGTAQVSGVVALVAGRAGLPVAFHTPSEVKAAVTGSGRAGKEQVTAMVTRVLSLGVAPRPADAADALALAVCHCWRAPMIARMAEAEARAAEVAKHHRARLAAARRAAR